MVRLALLSIPATLVLFALAACGGAASSPGAPAAAGDPTPSPSAAATADKATAPASPMATAAAPALAEPRELTTVYFVHASW